MVKEFLPQTKNNIMFSPLAVKEVFAKAVKDEQGNINNIFKKRTKYRQLLEMWYASYLAVGIYKWLGKKFFLIPSDSPDVYFVNKAENGEQIGFPVEVMELYDHSETSFDQNYNRLAKKVYKSKGEQNYGKCDLLLVARLPHTTFNVIQFTESLNKYKWSYSRIWLSSYNSAVKEWTIFEIIPYKTGQKIQYLTVHLNEQLF